jgi:hypothetical protein
MLVQECVRVGLLLTMKSGGGLCWGSRAAAAACEHSVYGLAAVHQVLAEVLHSWVLRRGIRRQSVGLSVRSVCMVQDLWLML